MEASEHIEVEMLEVEDEPGAVLFLFRPVDAGELTAQGLIDSLADFLLHQNPDALRLSPPKDAN